MQRQNRWDNQSKYIDEKTLPAWNKIARLIEYMKTRLKKNKMPSTK